MLNIPDSVAFRIIEFMLIGVAGYTYLKVRLHSIDKTATKEREGLRADVDKIERDLLEHERDAATERIAIERRFSSVERNLGEGAIHFNEIIRRLDIMEQDLKRRDEHFEQFVDQIKDLLTRAGLERRDSH